MAGWRLAVRRKVTPGRLCELLDYDEDEGVFTCGQSRQHEGSDFFAMSCIAH